MELPLSISNLQEQWLLSFLKKLDPANITELFWQLRPYVVLHHVEFKEASFSFSSVGIINFVDIVGFVRKNDTLGILLRNGCFYLFSAVSMDRQCILVCDPEFYKQTGRRLGGWSLCRETAIIVVENKGISASEYILMLYFFYLCRLTKR